MKFFRNYYHWQKWCPHKRSRSEVKVTEAKTQFSRFRTVTPVWIHIWWCNDSQSFMLRSKGALLFSRSSVKFKVYTAHPNSLILTQNWCFWTVNPVWIHQWLQNDTQSLKQHRRGALLFFKAIRLISRSHRTKNLRSSPELTVSGLKLQFEFTDGFEMMAKA